MPKKLTDAELNKNSPPPLLLPPSSRIAASEHTDQTESISRHMVLLHAKHGWIGSMVERSFFMDKICTSALKPNCPHILLIIATMLATIHRWLGLSLDNTFHSLIDYAMRRVTGSSNMDGSRIHGIPRVACISLDFFPALPRPLSDLSLISASINHM